MPHSRFHLRRRFSRHPLTQTIAILLTAVSATRGQAPSVAARPNARAAESQEATTLPTVVVSAQGDRTAYRAEEASSATRIAEPILDTARSVQVVTPQVLQDQAVNDPQDAVRNVSGTTRTGSYNGIGENFIVRGFVQQDIIKDGFRTGNASNVGLSATGPTDMANIDRVEVLKGPAAILYGRGEPGGVVNYQTKAPAFENRFSMQQSVGSYDFYRTELNANWNAVPDRFAIRVDAAYDRGNSFIDFVDSERWFVAPAFKLQIGPDTTLTFRGEYTHDERATNPGLPYENGRVVPGVAHDRYYGEPGFTEFEHETWRGLLQLEHRWSDWAKTAVSVHGRQSKEEGNYFLLFNFLGGPLVDPLTGSLARALSVNDHKDEGYAVRVDQTFDWTIYEGATASTVTDKDGHTTTTGGGGFPTIRNQLLIAGEFEREKQDRHRQLSRQESINVLDPHYTGGLPLPLIPIPGFPLPLNEFTDAQADAWSVLLMNRLSIGDTVYLSFGGRVEWFDAETTLLYPDPGTPFTSTVRGQTVTSFNPSAGLVVKPARNVSLYASYSESTNSFVNAFAAPTADGSSLDPETARQYEVGVKTEFFNKRLLATLSFFQIEKEDVVGADPLNPLFSINAGTERSRGFEVDISGEILPGWRVMANYAYIDAEVTYDPSGLNTGHRRYGVPENSGGIFTTYEIQEGALKGFGFGGGVYMADRVEVDNANVGNLSGYAQTDLVAYYQRNGWRAQINVKNLFDNKFYYATSNNTMVQPGTERTIVASLKYEF